MNEVTETGKFDINSPFYIESVSDTLYIRFNQYQFTGSGATRDADSVRSDPVSWLEGEKRKELPALVVASKAIADSAGSVPLFKLTLRSPLDSRRTVYVNNQLRRLMDWTPYLNWTTPQEWQFDQYNLKRLCLRKVCQQ